MANRSRAKRGRLQREKIESLKRRALERVTVTDAVQYADSTETTDEQLGVRGLLEDPRQFRSDLSMLQKYMGAAQFTEREVSAMLRRVGAIIAKTEDDRVRIQAFKTLLVQAKLSYDMDPNKPKTEITPQHIHQHGHVHLDANAGTSELAAIAAEIGITIDIEGTSGEEDYLEGSTRRAQPEVGGATPPRGDLEG